MIRYEYKVIPAPTRGKRGKGVKGADGKFAYALETLMNEMGAEGWEFQRAETLPSEERSGLTSKTTTYRNLLVFRRPCANDQDAFAPKLLDPPSDMEDEIEKDTARDEAKLDTQEDETRL